MSARRPSSANKQQVSVGLSGRGRGRDRGGRGTSSAPSPSHSNSHSPSPSPSHMAVLIPIVTALADTPPISFRSGEAVEEEQQAPEVTAITPFRPHTPEELFDSPSGDEHYEMLIHAPQTQKHRDSISHSQSKSQTNTRNLQSNSYSHSPSSNNSRPPLAQPPKHSPPQNYKGVGSDHEPHYSPSDTPDNVTDRSDSTPERAIPTINETSTDPLVLRIKLPNYTYEEVNIEGKAALFVKDLKYKLYVMGLTYFPPHRMKLVYKLRALNDNESLGDINFQHLDELDLVLRVTHDDKPLLLRYDEFVEQISPKHLSINVPVESRVEITLKPNRLNHVIYTPALLNYQRLCTQTSGFNALHLPPCNSLPSSSATTSPSASSSSDPSMPSYVSPTNTWTKVSFEHRAFLLKVEDDFDLRMDNIRYNAFDLTKRHTCTTQLGHTRGGSITVASGTGGVPKGDLHSWQRYTNELPVDCEILVSAHDSRLPHHLILIPRSRLKFNTTYAVLLANHVPSVPVQYHPTDYDFIAEGIGEDKLYVFKTERDSKERPQERVNSSISITKHNPATVRQYVGSSPPARPLPFSPRTFK